MQRFMDNEVFELNCGIKMNGGELNRYVVSIVTNVSTFDVAAGGGGGGRGGGGWRRGRGVTNWGKILSVSVSSLAGRVVARREEEKEECNWEDLLSSLR